MMIRANLAVILLASAFSAEAWHYTTPETTIIEETTIIQGTTQQEIDKGIAAAMAAGSHQFDFSTTDFQGSVTAAFNTGQSDDALSLGIAKRFDIFADVLLHSTYTQVESDDWVVIGGTFRF